MKKNVMLVSLISVIVLICFGCVSSGSSTPKTVYAPVKLPKGVVAVNDNTIGTGLNQFEYEPDWNYGPGGGEKYKDDDHYMGKMGAYFQVRFKGTNIKAVSYTHLRAHET